MCLLQVLNQLFKGVGLTQHDVCLVNDLAPYDATLLEALVNLNLQGGACLPRFSCISALWCGPEEDKNTVQAFIKRTIRNHVYSFVKDGRLVTDAGWVAGGEGMGSTGSGPPATAAPTYNEGDFKYTHPMPDGTLRLLQSVHDQWSSRPHFAARFSSLLQHHNKTFNPSEAWRLSPSHGCG